MSIALEYGIITKEDLKEAIKPGNKCITLINGSRVIGFVKAVEGEGFDSKVTLDLSSYKYSYLYFETPANVKLPAREVGYWIDKDKEFYNLDGESEAPF